MNRQEVFSKVVNHLIIQGEQAMLGETCGYRVERGGKMLKCAIGALLPDSPGLMGVNSTALPRGRDCGGDYAVLLRLVDEALGTVNNEDLQLLCRLQNVHDESANWDLAGLSEFGTGRLKRIAEDFRLECDL